MSLTLDYDLGRMYLWSYGFQSELELFVRSDNFKHQDETWLLQEPPLQVRALVAYAIMNFINLTTTPTSIHKGPRWVF